MLGATTCGSCSHRSGKRLLEEDKSLLKSSCPPKWKQWQPDQATPLKTLPKQHDLLSRY